MRDLYPSDLAKLDRDALEAAVQQRAQCAYLGHGITLARVLTRYKLLLHTADRGFACHVMMDGYWEIWLTQFFARAIKPGMYVVDVGANYGYYTHLFADIVTSAGHVLAVEPNPAAADLLRQSVLLNGFNAQVRIVETALGATQGDSAQLFVPHGEPKNAHLSTAPFGEGTFHTVPLTTLDHLVGLDRVDLVKIDAEGAEEDVIAGMRDTLHQHKPALILEFNTGRGNDPAALLDNLSSLYGGITFVDFDGSPTLVDRETVLTTRVGEDWMLYFAPTPT